MDNDSLRRMLVEQPKDQIMPQAEERRHLAQKFVERVHGLNADFVEVVSWTIKVRPTKEGITTGELADIAAAVKSPLYPDITVTEHQMEIRVTTDLWRYSQKAGELLEFITRLRTAEEQYRQFKAMHRIYDEGQERQVLEAQKKETAKQADIMIGS